MFLAKDMKNNENSALGTFHFCAALWRHKICWWKWTNILGWIEGEAQTEGEKYPRFEVEARIESEARDWAGEESGERARLAPLQKIFENSCLKPCNLVYSSSENPSFTSGGSWNLPWWARTSFRSQSNSATYVFESVVNSPVGSGAKPQLSTISVHF